MQSIPTGREGALGERVGAILFLASPASDYLAGETIKINGVQLMSENPGSTSRSLGSVLLFDREFV